MVGTGVALLARAMSEMLPGIVGASTALRTVVSRIEKVARTDSTVLILGETGTGKELVAAAIHAASVRRGAPFVALNCAAIPAGLLESELFGHERGAFTGAHARRIGRVEIAHEGTLFLDEIGEMPPHLQPRLLRVLQERRFERVGSSRTMRSDLRVVAATNRDLASMCVERAFREDLYYRLNVFPIRLPSLRERREDIPLLVRHFVSELSSKMNRDVLTVSEATMAALTAHDWPGNVRELQNVIERAVILGADTEVVLEMTNATSVPEGMSLADVNRAHILKVLRVTEGVVAGPKGAAARLGMKRSTLLYRMKKLGVLRSSI